MKRYKAKIEKFSRKEKTLKDKKIYSKYHNVLFFKKFKEVNKIYEEGKMYSKKFSKFNLS